MSAGIRFRAGLIVAVLWVLPWGIRGAEAEPSASCRDLAGRFSAAPEAMDLPALAMLGSCLATEIGVRVGVAEPPAGSSEEVPIPPAPSTPQEVLPPPPPETVTPQAQTRRYGDWPTPPAWTGTESWPSPNPW